MATETLQELTEEWKGKIREARERVLWIGFPDHDAYFSPGELEKMLQHGLKRIHAEAVLIDPQEVIRRKYQQIDSIRNEIQWIKRQCGY